MADSTLTADAVARFSEDGYLLCPGLAGARMCEALNEALSAVIQRIGAEHEQGIRKDEFWRQLPRSAGSIEVFWAPPGSREVGTTTPHFVESRVMRVGHALHLWEPAFAAAALRSPIAGALIEVLGPGAKVVQSAVVYKQPQSEIVQFGFHQDAAYLTSNPPSLALAFVALDDMDAENGALMVVPGSHRLGLGESLRLGPQGYEREGGRPHRFERSQAVLLPMRRGDVVLVDGLTYHASDPNRSLRPRRALIIHGLSAHAQLLPSSWVQEPPNNFARLGE